MAERIWENFKEGYRATINDRRFTIRLNGTGDWILREGRKILGTYSTAQSAKQIAKRMAAVAA